MKVTAEMRLAGAIALDEWKGAASQDEMAEYVFRAMLQASGEDFMVFLDTPFSGEIVNLEELAKRPD